MLGTIVDIKSTQQTDFASQAWYRLGVTEVIDRLGTSHAGLSAAEVSERMEQWGPNALPDAPQRSILQRWATQFHSPLIYVLLVTAAVTASLQHWADFGVIMAVVLINAIIGYLQEGRAERALAALRKMLSLEALVVRDNRHLVIPASGLVPGDVVNVRSGDRVPADIRLITVRELQIDEAILTGESAPVLKTVEACSATAPIAERLCMAYSGTLVVRGQATGVVVVTGAHTEVGRIGELVASTQTLTTPLMRQMHRFSVTLTKGILALAAVTFLFGIGVRHYDATEMFMAGVALAVAAIPEGLPAILTITLAIGVQRMAQRRAIIRRLPAVETLGCVGVICSDKTGTITCNEMMVQEVATAERLFRVSGEGYSPHGSFESEGVEIGAEESHALRELGRAAILCNDASLEQQEGAWQLQGDPTEGALLAFGNKIWADPQLLHEELPRTDVIPFESEHRFMATLHHDHKGRGFILLKGAPERVTERCENQRSEDGCQPLQQTYWAEQMEQMAGHGERLLAIAYKEVPDHSSALTFRDTDRGFTLMGILGISDPPRHDVTQAIARCREAGIRVKMITGDHATTALAVARQVGIDVCDRVLTGPDMAELEGAELAAAAQGANVIARASPEDKLRLVQALQSRGAVLAMTGDGVNDAPALKQADIGVAMGIKGTEAAKEAAEMVLTDDNFSSIVNAVEEGRAVYDNIRKSILFILPTNGGEAGIIMAAIAAGVTLPITPLQILWVNMITAITLALALAFEPPAVGVMRRPPRDVDQQLLSGHLLWRILLVTIVLVIGVFGLFLWLVQNFGDIDYARTVAVNTLVMFELFYLLNTRSISSSALTRESLRGIKPALIAIALVLLFQLLFTYLPPMQQLFDTTAIGWREWGLALAVAFSVFVIVEIEKALLRHHQQKNWRKLASS